MCRVDLLLTDDRGNRLPLTLVYDAARGQVSVSSPHGFLGNLRVRNGRLDRVYPSTRLSGEERVAAQRVLQAVARTVTWEPR